MPAASPGSAGDIDAGDTRTFSKINGPGWLTVAANGTLGGLPSNSDTGPNSFTVRVTDAAGLFDEASLNIAVANVNDAPVFTVDPIVRAAGSEEVAYSAALAFRHRCGCRRGRRHRLLQGLRSRLARRSRATAVSAAPRRPAARGRTTSWSARRTSPEPSTKPRCRSRSRVRRCPCHGTT